MAAQFTMDHGSNGVGVAIYFPTPEPSTLTLAAFGLLGLAYGRRRRPSKKTY